MDPQNPGKTSPHEIWFVGFSPPTEPDEMCEKKLELLNERGLLLTHDLTHIRFGELENANLWLDRVMETARILQLSETEWYFVEIGDKGPFSPRNEIEALCSIELSVRQLQSSSLENHPNAATVSFIHSLILSRLNACGHNSLFGGIEIDEGSLKGDLVSGQKKDGDSFSFSGRKSETLNSVQSDSLSCGRKEDYPGASLSTKKEDHQSDVSETSLSSKKEDGLGKPNECLSSKKEGHQEDELETSLSSWAASQGIKSLIHPAVFEKTGRGAAASKRLDAGDLVVEIPRELIISEDMALESEMGPAFQKIKDLGRETMALLWSMKERYNKKSKFAPFFAFLPEFFYTGLEFGIDGFKALEGTQVLDEISEAKVHLRDSYNSLFPDLSNKYPDVFPKEYFSLEQFLWACQLWYSYGMKVKFPSGTVQTCLVPMASLLNHAIFPHVTHFSSINESTNSLQLSALRQCDAGEQCFMSYGALGNSDLLKFYGFVIDRNPYDMIPIDLALGEICQSPEQFALIETYNVLSSHMVRGFHSLPSRLIAALRIACMDEEDFTSYMADPRLEMVNLTNEENVYWSLLSTVDSLLDPLLVSDESSIEISPDDDTLHWEVPLAKQFKISQKRVLQSVKIACESALSSL